MKEMRIDIGRMEESGKKLLSLALRYDNQVSNFYERINQINRKTNEWIGPDVEKYIAAVNSSKISYELIGKIIKKYGEILVKNAQTINTVGELNKLEWKIL